MFSLGKLLIESPEKIIKLLMVLLKISVTIWILSIIDDSVPLNTKDVSMDKIFVDVSVFDTIYYLALLVFLWFLIWEVLFNLIFQFMAFFFSEFVADETAFRIYLKIMGVAKFKGEKLERLNPQVTWFTESLESQSEKPSIVTLDLVEISGVSILAFSALCYSGHLKWNEIGFWIAIFFILNFSISAIFQKKWVEYYDSQRPKLRAEFYSFGKQQQLREAIDLVEILEENYSIIVKRKFIELIIKPECKIDWMPKSIVFRHIFIPDEQIGARVLSELRGNLSSTDKIENHKVVYISNVSSDQTDDSIIIVSTMDEMYTRVKDLVLQWKRSYYSKLIEDDLSDDE